MLQSICKAALLIKQWQPCFTSLVWSLLSSRVMGVQASRNPAGRWRTLQQAVWIVNKAVVSEG